MGKALKGRTTPRERFYLKAFCFFVFANVCKLNIFAWMRLILHSFSETPPFICEQWPQADSTIFAYRRWCVADF